MANLITELALTMPVAYIKNIVFYNNGKAVGDCNWEQPDGQGTIIFDQFQPAYLNLYKNFDNFTHVVVSAVDAEGRQLHIRQTVADYKKEKF